MRILQHVSSQFSSLHLIMLHFLEIHFPGLASLRGPYFRQLGVTVKPGILTRQSTLVKSALPWNVLVSMHEMVMIDESKWLTRRGKQQQ